MLSGRFRDVAVFTNRRLGTLARVAVITRGTAQNFCRWLVMLLSSGRFRDDAASQLVTTGTMTGYRVMTRKRGISERYGGPVL
jgi:hypothetical protein